MEGNRSILVLGISYQRCQTVKTGKKDLEEIAAISNRKWQELDDVHEDFQVSTCSLNSGWCERERSGEYRVLIRKASRRSTEAGW